MLKNITSRRLLVGPVILLAIAATVFAVLMTTESSAQGQESLVSTSPNDIAAGAVLFETHCESCHGYEGRGGVVKGAPALVNVGAAAADFYLTTGRMPLDAPNEEALRHHPLFTNTQIRQLVAYINDLPKITGIGTAGPTIPTPLPLCKNTKSVTADGQTDCVTLSEGQQLYAINCAECHQAAADGGMLSKGNVIPSLHNANIVQVMEAPTIGPKPMPTFSELTETQLSAIAHYVEYLHKPSSPGGIGLPFGPVGEGFIAILVGFVLLWFAARMIGTR